MINLHKIILYGSDNLFHQKNPKQLKVKIFAENQMKFYFLYQK